MKFFSVLVCVACLSAGCLSNRAKVLPLPTPVHERVFSYTAYEVVQRVLIGTPMVYKIDGGSVAGFVARVSFQPEPEHDGGLLFPRIESGSEWRAIGRTPSGDYVCENKGYPHPVWGDQRMGWSFCLMVNKLGEPYGYAHCDTAEVLVHRWRKTPGNFLRKENQMFVKGSYKQELTYQSCARDTITVMYREYRDDLTQPLFSKTFVFDLSRSKIIAIKGLHLEVLEATPEYIRFKVMTPFD